MKNLLARVQKNRFFRLAASVKMAVVLILTLAAVVATGTIYESTYNAQVAGILVYHSYWFLALLGLFWVNIFCATISRIPFRRHHTGFVITHIGLLTLLSGSAITFLYGVDGQLTVEEGGRSRTVLLNNMVIKAVREGSSEIHVFPIARSLQKNVPKSDDFSAFTGLSIQDYIPTAAKSSGHQGGGAGFALAFGLKSQFFNVNETLFSSGQAELKMGPARIRLVEDRGGAAKAVESHAAPPTQVAPHRRASAGKAVLTVVDAKSGKELTRFELSKIRAAGAVVAGVKIEIANEYKNAVVSNNHLTDGSGEDNPALELKLSKGKEVVREVAYQKFPTFSLSPGGFFGLRFHVSGLGGGTVPPAAMPSAEAAVPGTEGDEHSDRMGNVIEFHVTPGNLQSATVKLYKNNQKVLEKTLMRGETVTTPWMGMAVTLADLKWSNGTGEDHSEDPVAVEIPRRSPLPPSAVKIGGQWLMEGEAKKYANGNEKFEIYYGEDSIDLPFEILLHKFEKVDYPGTEMALSFQSLVSIDGNDGKFLIRMNEPLQRAGYVLYQSSYLLEPGQKPVSVFSVNKDPGRWVKYLGAVILVLGIFVFIVMRSSWYLRKVSS